jgi:hypothetical protein
MKSISTSTACNLDSCLIDVTGLCTPSDVTEIISTNPFWQQQYIIENLIVPEQKPDIEQINSINVGVEILKQTVIKTPRSFTNTTPPVPVPNLEGKLLTGRKLVIEGEICQKILYTADEATQPVHSVDFFVPFSSFIVVPREITTTDANGNPVTVDTLTVNFTVGVCVENVFACLEDNRTIFKQVVMLLYAVPTNV